MGPKPRIRFSELSYSVKVFNRDGTWIKLFPRESVDADWRQILAWSALTDNECRDLQRLRH